MSTIDIEQIVREVLQRIESHGDGPTRATPGGQSLNGPPASTPPQGLGDLALTDRVISLSHVEGKLHGIRQVTATASAVVTPSARDYLKAHNVQLNVRAADTDRPARGELFLATFATEFDPHPLCTEITNRGVVCRITRARSMTSILTQWTPRLASGAVAVILTGEPDVALCVANRHTPIRAFAANDPASLSRARPATGGNLLIVDPTRCSNDDLREMACAMANHTCEIPIPWRALL